MRHKINTRKAAAAAATAVDDNKVKDQTQAQNKEKNICRRSTRLLRRKYRKESQEKGIQETTIDLVSEDEDEENHQNRKKNNDESEDITDDNDIILLKIGRKKLQSSLPPTSPTGSQLKISNSQNQMDKSPVMKKRKHSKERVRRKINFTSPGPSLDSTYLTELNSSLSSTASSSSNNGIEEELKTSILSQSESDIIQVEITSCDQISLSSSSSSPSKPNDSPVSARPNYLEIRKKPTDDFQVHSIASDESNSSSSSIVSINSPCAPSVRPRSNLSGDSPSSYNFLEDTSVSLVLATSTPKPSCSTSFQANNIVALTDSSDDFKSAKDDSFTACNISTTEVTGTELRDPGIPEINLDQTPFQNSERLDFSQELEILEETLINDILENYNFDDETEKLLEEKMIELSEIDWDSLNLKLRKITQEDLTSILQTETEIGTETEKDSTNL